MAEVITARQLGILAFIAKGVKSALVPMSDLT